tara:strand:- start:1833 stop:2540 length:708 start_codon:yes stop_codon:yes gene_type:complete
MRKRTRRPVKKTDARPIKRGKDKKSRRTTVKPVNAKTDNHHDYIMSIINNPITICVGPAGSGKSYISAGMFANFLYEESFDQLIATRPLVCSGKDLGSLPGEMNEKIAPYLKPIEENIKSFLGQANYGLHFNNGKIRYEPLEVMRGATFDYSCMILDEAQNCTLDQLKMFITRMGINSKIVINGDINQTDLRSRSGLETLIRKVEDIEGVGVCYLTHDDIQRNGIIGEILRALEE